MAGAQKIAIVFLLSLALLLQTGFCAWNQTLVINVSNQNGMPVSDASIKITYQKANGITGSDGTLKGYTDDTGIYSANISNTVPADLEDRKIIVTVNTSQWDGEERVVWANSTEDVTRIQFVAPVLLEKLTIIVLTPDGNEAPGASIYITDSPNTRTADLAGKTVIYMETGKEITGFASYQSNGEYFSSANSTLGIDGEKAILVRLPAQASEKNVNKTAISVRFISIDNKPVSNENVVFYADGNEVPARTDEMGIATVNVSETWEMCAKLRQNDYDYLFSFNITADGTAKEEIAVLYKLLKLENFESKPDGNGCYLLSAKVTDPRTGHPLSIKFIPLQNGSTLGELPVLLDDNCFYSARICAEASAKVMAIAANTYETVEKTISLSDPQLIQTNTTMNCMQTPVLQANTSAMRCMQMPVRQEPPVQPTNATAENSTQSPPVQPANATTANATQPPPVQPTNATTANATQPPPPPNEPPPAQDEGPNAMIIVAVLLVVVFGVFVIVMGKKNSDLAEKLSKSDPTEKTNKTDSSGGKAGSSEGANRSDFAGGVSNSAQIASADKTDSSVEAGGAGSLLGVFGSFSHTIGNVIGTVLRPMIEYLHSIFKNKEPPPSSSFGRR